MPKLKDVSRIIAALLSPGETSRCPPLSRRDSMAAYFKFNTEMGYRCGRDRAAMKGTHIATAVFLREDENVKSLEELPGRGERANGKLAKKARTEDPFFLNYNYENPFAITKASFSPAARGELRCEFPSTPAAGCISIAAACLRRNAEQLRSYFRGNHCLLSKLKSAFYSSSQLSVLHVVPAVGVWLLSLRTYSATTARTHRARP